MTTQNPNRLPACPLPSVLGLNREQASAYIGVSPSLFDKAVAAGTMPQPRLIGQRNVWDVDELTACFKAMPHRNSQEWAVPSASGGNAWDDAKLTN